MHKFFYEQRKAFSFRKLTIGLVSLCVGTSLLFGIQSQEVSASTVSPSQIRFEYVLEAELSAEERQLIQSSLPAELKEEATYFVVYRPSKKVLPATGELAGSGLAVLGLGFLVLAVSATKSKKARVLTMLYVTTSGLALPVLEVGAVQSSALAAYNQTYVLKPGEALPDGRLTIAGYDFVGYFIEEKSEVKSQARDEKTSLSTSNQLEESKTSPETAEVDKQISTGEVSGKPDQASQPIVEQADKTEQTGKAEESQDQAAQPTEAAVEEKLITTIPTEAPSHLLPTIDFQVQDKVEEIALEIPEEQIETNQLPLGQSRVEEGQAGSLRISYQEVLVDGQVIARKEISREEIPSTPRKVYIGTGQVVEGEVTETDSPEEPVQPTEAAVEEKLITTIPTEAPIHHLPTIDFQVQDKVEEIALEIPEEQIETDELAIGQSRVEEGQAGSLRISYQEVLVAGQIVARNEISREETPSIPKRTYIGTRRDEKYVAPAKLELPTATIRTQEEEISFERKEVLRPDWPLGKVEVVAGKKGKQLHTYAVIEGVETLLKTEVLEQAEAEITYKGVNRPETTTEEIVIDFTERVISDPEQYTDYRQIEVTGEQGLKRLHKENGQLVNEEIVKPAKEQVVRVGTKPIKGQVEKESLRTIEFTRRYESNDQLDYGQTRTKQPGQSGQEKVISTYQTIKGVEGQFISSRIVPVRPVQDEIIEVGTKPQIRIEQEEPVIEYVPEPAKERNVQTVLQEGHAKETTYRTVYNLDANSGQVIPIHLPGTVSHPGQVRRISVGTKPTITKKALPFTEETIPNSTLYVGERVIVRPGRAGEEITTVHYTLNPRTGETSASQPLIQVIAAVTQVAQVGTKAVDRTEETVDSRAIEFKIEYRADSTLPYPQREELQSGSNGVERITITRRYVRDQEVGEPSRVSEVVKAVQNRIIKVGTKPAVRRVETDFTRVYEADPNRSLNERHVKQSGIKQETTYTKNYVLNTETGEVREQAETRQVTRFARQEIVQVGTRPTTETTSRVLPTRYEADITRAYGQQYISQQGRPEITIYTTTYRVDPRTGSTQGVRDTGRVTDSGQEQIIQVGTQPVERTERIELPEIRRQNANLAKDTETVIYAGSPTIRLYRTSYTVNPDTGQLTALQEVLVSEIAGRAREVEIGAKEPEQPVTPPVENEGSCPIVPDNTDGGTCEAPTEPAEKPSSTDSGTTIVPEPEQPNISETEPVSPKKPEETTEETVEDVNKPLLRVVKNEPHYHLMKHVRSSKVTYELKDTKKSFKKAVAKLYVNDKEIESTELNKESLNQGKFEVRFRNLLPNVDYFVRTDLVYTDSKNVERTERIHDEVHVDFEERHFEIKNIDEVEVWKNEDGRLVRKVAIKVDPNDVQNYFIKLKSDEHKDVLLPVAKIEKTSLDNVTHFKLQARFTNPEEKTLKTSSYHDIVTVYLPRESRENYSTFSKLLEAMRNQPYGTFELKQDLTASEVDLSASATSYLSGQFGGTLKGNGFTIHDLKVPLFNDLRGNVSDLNLKAVDIQLPKETKVGALAKQSDNATITNVHAQGHVFAENKIGGLIGEAYQTNMTNISFNGEIAGLKNVDNNMIGGIAGWLGGGKIEKGYVDATISAVSSNVKAGGLVGQMENANTQILSSFATGSIATTKTKDTEVGGLVGAILKGNSQDNSIQLRDNIAAVHVVNGHKVYGRVEENLQPFSDIRIVTGKAVGENNPSASITEIDADGAEEELKAWSILPSEKEAARKLRQKNAFDIDYATAQFALAERKQAYENMEKLLPFFTRDVIIQYGNRLEKDDELVTKKLLDVVPLVDKVPFLDILGTSTGKNNQDLPNRDKINGLLLHFDDGTVKYQYLVKKKDMSRGAVTEYLILDKNISYTPDVMANDFEYKKLLGSLISEFEGITFDSSAVQDALGLNGNPYSRDKEWLFLKESFENVKSNLQAHLSELISNYNLVGLDSSTANHFLKSHISKNKAQLLLGLAYMNRWYNIQFGDFKAKNLMMKKADFFGQNVNSLDQLIRIGSMGAEMLKPKNNYALASQVIAKESIGGDLFDYLEGYRKAFAPKMTNNDWFKSSTKATIIETPSTIKEVLEKQTNPTKDVHHNGFYEKLAGENWKFKEMALILLAMPSKDIFILTDMANTLIGMYDNNQGVLEERLQEIAKMWAGHADYLYNILPEEHKEKMFRRTITWDTKDINNDWKALDKLTSMNYSGMKHFYLPLGYVYPNESKGAHADTRMDGIYFFRHDAIMDDGARVYTHEMTHIGDDNTLLLGYGKRTGLDFEVYARGLFESITWDNQDRFGINNIYDFSKYDERNYGRRLTNKTPERFKSTQDLQDYMKGYLDVIYTLDILEAEAVLGLSNSQAKQNWFNQMVTQNGNTSVANQFTNSFTSLDQLIDNGMISRRPYGYGYNSDANAYLEVRAFDPIYGSLNNDGTSRNEYEVRKIAFELLAEYGYENGMVPYLSDQHKKTLGQSEAYGRMKDSDLISLISKETYKNSAEFRKAMFAKRQQRLENLKPVELITKNLLNGDGYFYETTRTVNSATELRQLMQAAVEYDATHQKYYSQNGQNVGTQSRVYSLKAAVLNGYLRATNDFRESIYVTNP
ncbi:TPA: G5 domain-containing protein [Streptococcus suis]|uniref:ZmpA/ZmpB/ZmpC family metallo-endopeptidase n=3 Tax=Streptococcus suis TaxID=1307 RepID=UPI000698BA87|nr:ZmpA/ZmpB/ZmpC family metallo-endopeptidase [Streptococcus suis]MCQ8785394.1 G5 domain-containing protein [Streptococcus suis]NQH42059.1 YSIRK-type signal peptide-containing protein [Streptococcus suis]NQH56568.1 YSIRK-type signal peptide-containing protein [Streptococcus suis]NQO52783.1 YSIRK-type signal peptide-containing protein [Streptococcus suis]NQR44401.1 YSIRK-type signal peptide-containing protein [Streptococcus suis]